jgi:hypothetical protein
MNPIDCPVARKLRVTAWIVGALGTLLIMVVLVGVMIRVTRPEDLAAARARERRQFLQEVRQAEAQAVASYAWVARDKGFVSVPIDRSMELVLAEWQNPAAARSNLIARVAKAKEPPPKPPEPANPYE